MANDTNGNGRPGSPSTHDHGAEDVGSFIAVGLIDLGRPGVGYLARLCGDTEGFRVDAERAGHLLRLFGFDVSRPYRIELRNKRRLLEERRRMIDKLFRVCEIDLPPE